MWPYLTDKVAESVRNTQSNLLLIFSIISFLKLVSFLLFIKYEVMVLVSDPINPIPIIINTTAINLPKLVLGEMSPYPTVVAVTNDHHRPS